jgi:hypothetical protein
MPGQESRHEAAGIEMIQISERYLTFFNRITKPAFIGLLLLVNCFAFWNFMLLSRDLIYGDHSADQLLLRPLYRPLRVPVRPVTQARQAIGRIGSDFAQVYFPAQNVSRLQDAFDPHRTLDPWRRPSRYAPLVIVACAASLCRLDFGQACFLHMLLQILLLYAVLYWAFWLLGIRKYFLASLLFVNICLFLTPVGLTWFERGQFSLYLASSYTVLVLGLVKRNPALMAAAALLAFIKWTSFPAVFVILAVYLVSSRSLAELKSNLFLVSIFGAVTGALLMVPALFTRGADTFVQGLLAQEFQDLPKGVSLLRYVPRVAVKLLPLAVILVGYINVRSKIGSLDWLVPYSAGVVTIMLVYPTRAYEYGLPTVLGFLPLLLFWTSQVGSERNITRYALVCAFLLFVLVASFSTRLVPSLFVLVQIYVVFALLLMLSPLLLSLSEYLIRRSASHMHQA